MSVELPGEDDDSKRRRNLMSFAVAVCVAAFLDIELKELLEKAVPAIANVPRWKTFAAAMAADLYLLFRYSIRDTSRVPVGTLLSPDIADIKQAFRTQQQRMLDRWFEGRKVAQQRAGLGRTIPYQLFDKNPVLVLQDLLASDEAPALPSAEFEWSLIYSGEAPLEAIGATVTHKVVSREKVARVNIDRASWAWRKLNLRTAAKVAFLSKEAVDVLLPYYLGLGAAACMAWRFFT